MENVNVIEKEAVVNEFMLTLAEAKLLEELSEPHSPDLDLIQNLLRHLNQSQNFLRL